MAPDNPMDGESGESPTTGHIFPESGPESVPEQENRNRIVEIREYLFRPSFSDLNKDPDMSIYRLFLPCLHLLLLQAIKGRVLPSN